MQQRPVNITTKDIKAALLEARAKIASGECEFICLALPDTPAGYYLQDYIEEAIVKQTGYRSLSNFVYQKTGDPLAYNSEAIRKYRLCYIDWMLDQ